MNGGQGKFYGLHPLFRVAGSSKSDPAVDRWMNQQTPELGILARTWFLRIRKSGPNVRAVSYTHLDVYKRQAVAEQGHK